MDATAKAHAGIQKLLQAEQDAAEIVAKAKQDKVARLKQAKAEADEEIAAYKVRTVVHLPLMCGRLRGCAARWARLLEGSALLVRRRPPTTPRLLS
jgi:hypothetical protein